MPKTTQYEDGGTLIEYSPEEISLSIRTAREVSKRMGWDEKKEAADPRPSIQSVSQVVAWAFAYAPSNNPLNESHPLWEEFFQQSEWFREQITQTLSLPKETKWEEIYRLSGFLIEEEYGNEEKFWEAHYFGEMNRLDHIEATGRLKELEFTKFRIVGRI